MGPAKLDTASITGCEQRIFVAGTAVPNWPDGMDHMPRLEPVAFGDLGVAGLAAVQCPAFDQQFRSGSIMDSAIDAAPAKERRIGRVDDSVNAQRGDVGNDDFQPRLADPARRIAQADAAALTVTPLSANSCCNSPA